LAYEETSGIDEVLQSAEKGVFDITHEGVKKGAEPISAIVVKSLKRMEDASKSANGLTGVPCGFTTLDRITGGWQDTDLVILAARPSQGKTALGLNIAKGASEMGRPVAFFSLEMSSTQLVNRLLASDSEINGEHILRGTLSPAQWPSLMASAENISDLPLFIDDTSSINILELKSKCRKLKMERGIKLIVVDYLQLMTGERQKGDSRDREIGTISAGLKAIAKELEVPVIALSQLSRANEQRGGSKKPMLSDLRESGNIEQDADIVMFIHRPEYYGIMEDEDGASTKGKAEIIFAKHRNGAVGSVDLMFKPQFTKFMDIESFDFEEPKTVTTAVTPSVSKDDEPIPF
jgi:replicative DNA helicase